jgi:hypothetical protein
MLGFNELVEGVEYWLIDEHGKKYKEKYAMVSNKFCVKTESHRRLSQLGINVVLAATFEECEWTPKIGETVYYPDPWSEEVVDSARWLGYEDEVLFMKRVGVYRTREEAIAKAKELGWT